uniref:Leucine-rich immune protein (Short) n=1 Tax=Anopheles funestus TaxID=62324 RepID=A0A182RSM2_ANOFN
MVHTRVLLSVLVLTLTTGSESVTTYRCDPNRLPIVATCLVRNVTLTSEADILNANFPNDMRYVALSMVDGFVPEFTRELALKLPTVQDLNVDAMGITKFYIWKTIEVIAARNNSIREVLFDAEHHQLRSLQLDDNRLSKVPPFGKWFNELKLLSLDGNRLEQVTLDSFAEMEHLQSLSLARNGLIRVEPTLRVANRPVQGVQLLKLKHFSLAANHLLTVNISEWEMPSLVSLDLSNNDLYMLLDQPRQFRHFGALLNVSYAGNDWNCEWLSEAQLVLHEQGIATPAQDLADRCERENMKKLKGICCYDHAFEQKLAQDPFESRWEQLNELRRRYELVQFAYDQVEDNDLNLITEQAHELRGKLVGPVAQEQDVVKSELLRLQHALANENAHLQRLQDEIERTVHDLGQSIDELHERAVRPKPTLDAVHHRMTGVSIVGIRDQIEFLRRHIHDYVYKISEREKRLRRYDVQIKQLEEQLVELKELQQSLAEWTTSIATPVYKANQILDSIKPKSEEAFNQIRTLRNGDYIYSYRG